MARVNQVMFLGNLTRDPELRYTPGGDPKAVCGMSLAINRIGRNGNPPPPADFIEIEVWEKLAEACEKHLKKGSPIFVNGELRLKRWEVEGGGKRSKHVVVASEVQFLNKKATPAGTKDEGAAAEPAGVAAGSGDAEPQPHGDDIPS